MTDPIDTIRRAVGRATELLSIMDEAHTHVALYSRVRAVREELRTIDGELANIFSDVLAPSPGKVGSRSPETSRAAARAIATRSGSQRHRLLGILAGGDYTDWQLQALGAIGASSERPRRLELVEAGYVQAAREDVHGEGDGALITRPHPDSGLDCQVWTITAKGRAALRQLEAGQLAMAFPAPSA